MECGYRDIEVAQILTHLEFVDLRYGLILNFNVKLMKYGIKRVLRGYSTVKD